MPFKDVREFIDKLEEEKELKRIEEEVDWNLEAGAMIRRAAEAGLPALLFEKIKDYPKGYRLCGGLGANYRRLAITMDMAPDTHPGEIIEEHICRKQQPIKPTLVSDGPCKENIQIGSKVDLLGFPVPMIHIGDGGRYIGTWHLTINKDSGSDWVNWGMYRHMLHNKNTVAMYAEGNHHGMQIFLRSYESRNKAMDIAIVIGVEPALTMAATSPVPYGTSEVDIAGGIRGEPVELIKCETIDLAVPATAEIVIEGEIRPYERMDEGPFGEFSGYIAGLKEPRPVIHVKAVTHRNNPILTMSCPGEPADGDVINILGSLSEILQIFRAKGLPVSGCGLIQPGGPIVVAIKNTYIGVVEDVALAVWASPLGAIMPYLIIVEDDIDPFDPRQVIRAIVSQCNPSKGIVKLERAPAIHLTPWLDRHERETRMAARVYFDCTWPLNWDPADVPTKITFAKSYPPEVQQKVLALWRKYGY